jgi:hypothetical protein
MLRLLLSGEVHTVRTAVDEEIRRIYGVLREIDGPSTPARERATREWWSPPDAWGPDIDDPSIEDWGEDCRHEFGEDCRPDRVLVDRVVAGQADQQDLALVCGDRGTRVWMVAHLTDVGRSAQEIANTLCVSKRMVERDRAEWRRRAAMIACASA